MYYEFLVSHWRRQQMAEWIVLLAALVWLASYVLLPRWTAANGVQRINFASINAMLIILLYLLTRVG